MAEIINFPTQDTSVAYISKDANNTADRAHIKNHHVLEYDPDYVSPFEEDFSFEGVKGAPYSFRAYDITAREGLKLLERYQELMLQRS